MLIDMSTTNYGAYPTAPTPPANQDNAQPYASWGKRVLSYLIDCVVPTVFLTVAMFAFLGSAVTAQEGSISDAEIEALTQKAIEDAANGGTPNIELPAAEPADLGFPMLALVLYFLAFAIIFYNSVYLQGRTGQSWGRKATRTKLVNVETGKPVGVLVSLLRQIAHIADGAIFYIGYLWPLWDAKRQTFADKIVGSVVVEVDQ